MTEAALQQISLNGTRLIRILAQLQVSNLAFSHERFAERLGGVIDFGDSVRLSGLLDKIGSMPDETGAASDQDPRADLLHVRMSLARSVAEGFVPDVGMSRLKLPTLKSGVPLEDLTRFEPYHRFYAAHQREFEVKIQSLQLRVRDGVSGVSAEAARLAALDEAVRDTLSMHTRKYLAVIPQLLGKRFDFLQQQHQSRQEASGESIEQPEQGVPDAWTRPDGWLGRFFRELQGVLLAELELRLLPVLGLLEAADETKENLITS